MGISRTKNHAYVVNVRIAIADDPAFIAARPWIPRRNTPRFIVDMLEIDGCLTCSGDTVLPTQAKRLSAQSMNRFIADLTSPNRTVPIIVVAALRGMPGIYPMNPGELARKLRGSAVVYAVDFSDYQVRQEYRKHFVPGESSFEYRVNNGFARVYFPKVDLENADESKRHHFYTLDKLKQSNVDNISDDICGAITRLYQRKPGEALDFVSIEAIVNRAKRQDIEKKYRELQAYRLEEDKRDTVDTTLLHTEEEFQSAIEQLTTRIEKLSSDNEFYVQYIDELESESASQELDLDALELNDRIQSLEAECRQKESTISSLKHSIREISQSNTENASNAKAIKRQARLIQTMSEFPRTAYDALELAKEAFGDRLIFLDEAVESARKFTSGEADEMFDILRTVYVDLWPLYFGSDNFEGEIDKAYAARTGYELSFNESSMTNKDQKLRKLRLREYKGQTIDISPHIKGTQGKRTEPLRVHFFVDKNEEKIVIGHCGAHMDTAGTRRAKK